MSSPALSTDSQRVAVTRTGQGNNDVWTIDIARDILSPVTSEPGLDNSPLWSPDGRLLLASTRYGVFEILRSPLAGPAERIVSLKESVIPQSLSTDGQTLVFARQSSNTATDLWAKSMNTEDQPFAVVQTRADDFSAHLSPDIRWLVYESTMSGRSEVWAQRFPSAGERWQISRNGGSQPRWRPDGRELFYVAPDGHIMGVSVSPSLQNLEFGRPVPLFRPQLVTQLPAPAFRRPQYDVNPDGRFLVNRELEAPSTPPIQLLVNWPQLLKR